MPAGIFDTSSGTIWNHDNGYENPSATENAHKNNFGQNLLDPTGLVSGLWNDLTGVTAQSREFSQQEYLQDKMNEYNTPENQMQRMVAAGINPNLAAQGIAGSGSQSAQAPSVSSNTSGASQGLSAVGSAVGGIAGAALSVSQKRQADSQANLFDVQSGEINALLDFKKNQYAADTAKSWAEQGMDNNLASYWSTKAAWATKQERADYLSKVYQVKRAKSEIKILDKEYEIKIQDLKLRKEQVTQAEYDTQIKAFELEKAQRANEILNRYGIDVSLGEDAMLLEAADGGFLDFISSAFGAAEYERVYQAYQADVATIEERTEKRVQKELEAKIAELEKNNDLQKELAKYGVKGELMKYILRDIVKYLFGTGFSVKGQGPLGIGGSISNSPGE